MQDARCRMQDAPSRGGGSDLYLISCILRFASSGSAYGNGLRRSGARLTRTSGSMMLTAMTDYSYTDPLVPPDAVSGWPA